VCPTEGQATSATVRARATSAAPSLDRRSKEVCERDRSKREREQDSSDKRHPFPTSYWLKPRLVRLRQTRNRSRQEHDERKRERRGEQDRSPQRRRRFVRSVAGARLGWCIGGVLNCDPFAALQGHRLSAESSVARSDTRLPTRYSYWTPGSPPKPFDVGLSHRRLGADRMFSDRAWKRRALHDPAPATDASHNGYRPQEPAEPTALSLSRSRRGIHTSRR
jgi:hypothetical protein